MILPFLNRPTMVWQLPVRSPADSVLLIFLSITTIDAYGGITLHLVTHTLDTDSLGQTDLGLQTPAGADGTLVSHCTGSEPNRRLNEAQQSSKISHRLSRSCLVYFQFFWSLETWHPRSPLWHPSVPNINSNLIQRPGCNQNQQLSSHL